MKVKLRWELIIPPLGFYRSQILGAYSARVHVRAGSWSTAIIPDRQTEDYQPAQWFVQKERSHSFGLTVAGSSTQSSHSLKGCWRRFSIPTDQMGPPLQCPPEAVGDKGMCQHDSNAQQRLAVV